MMPGVPDRLCVLSRSRLFSKASSTIYNLAEWYAICRAGHIVFDIGHIRTSCKIFQNSERPGYEGVNDEECASVPLRKLYMQRTKAVRPINGEWQIPLWLTTARCSLCAVGSHTYNLSPDVDDDAGDVGCFAAMQSCTRVQGCNPWCSLTRRKPLSVSSSPRASSSTKLLSCSFAHRLHLHEHRGHHYRWRTRGRLYLYSELLSSPSINLRHPQDFQLQSRYFEVTLSPSFHVCKVVGFSDLPVCNHSIAMKFSILWISTGISRFRQIVTNSSEESSLFARRPPCVSPCSFNVYQRFILHSSSVSVSFQRILRRS